MITFKQFLSEKAMNASEFSKTEQRQGENAHVGFEFECIVSERSKLLADRDVYRDFVDLTGIADFKDLTQYFKMSKDQSKNINTEKSNWAKKQPDDVGLDLWETFVSSEYGSWYKLVKAHNLIPWFGWEADTGQDSSRVYIEDSADSDDPRFRMATYMKIEDDLSNFLNTNVTVAHQTAAEHYEAGDWIIVYDGSIDPDDNGVPVEINSPPLKLSKALKDLNTMFKWMAANDIDTNETTGLHINISMPGIQNVDLVKLVMFMGDKYVLKQFDRLNNEFTKSQATNILNNVAGTGELPREAGAMIKLARSALSDHKYSSVHITKLKHGYLEFRIAGNAGYHHKYEMIRDTVLRFVTALEIAIDPKAERNEYLKKLSKIFAIADEGESNTDFDARPLVDVVDFAGEETTAKMLTNFLAQAKEGKLNTPSGRERVKTWFHDVFLKSLFRAFAELGIKTVSNRQKAEFKLIMKRLHMDPTELKQQEGFEFAWKKDVLRKLGF